MEVIKERAPSSINYTISSAVVPNGILFLLMMMIARMIMQT